MLSYTAICSAHLYALFILNSSINRFIAQDWISINNSVMKPTNIRKKPRNHSSGNPISGSQCAFTILCIRFIHDIP